MRQLSRDQARLLEDASRYAAWRQDRAPQLQELQELDRDDGSVSHPREHVSRDRFEDLAAG